MIKLTPKIDLPGRIILPIIALACVQQSQATISITSGSATVASFDGYTGAGLTPGSSTAGSLDSNTFRLRGDGPDMAFGDSRTNTRYAGGVTNGSGSNIQGPSSVYSAVNTTTGTGALWIVPRSSPFNPTEFTVRYKNETGSTITALEISYLGIFNNDSDRQQAFGFSYAIGTEATYTDISSLGLLTPQASDTNLFTTVDRSGNASGLSIANGDSFFMKFAGGSNTGSGGPKDGFGIDNLSVTATIATVSAVPEPSSGLFLGGMMGVLGLLYRNRRK